MPPIEYPRTEISLAEEALPTKDTGPITTDKERVCRYVGRLQNLEQATEPALTFDDAVLPATLADAISSADVVFIDDPLSFPWNSIDLDVSPLVIVDASSCNEGDVTALLPVLQGLTPADTTIGITASAQTAATTAVVPTRSQPPTPQQWAELRKEKHVLRADDSIARRAAREHGDSAILHRIEVATMGQHASLHAHLVAIADEVGGRAVGLWGVRSAPGAPLHHGWAVFVPAGNAS